jgi:hypothetical protein
LLAATVLIVLALPGLNKETMIRGDQKLWLKRGTGRCPLELYFQLRRFSTVAAAADAKSRNAAQSLLGAGETRPRE